MSQKPSMNSLTRICSLVKVLRWGIVMGCMLVPAAYAAPVATFSSGKLSGFTDLLIGGAHFDVSIQDGTCAGVFGAGTGGSLAQAGGLCNVGSFAFHSAATAHAANDALYAAIVAEGYAARPDDIFDPAHAPPHNSLIFWTPYADSSTLGIISSDLRICVSGAPGGCGANCDGQIQDNRPHLTTTAGTSNAVWAVFAPVAEPET